MSSIEVSRGDVEAAVGAAVASYDVEPIDPQLRIHSVTGGVFRVRGTTAGGATFSVVVKVVRHGVDTDPQGLWVAGADPTHRNYWKREWLAFDSRLLDRMPGRLRAPRTLLTTEPAPDECWIWMSDVDGRTGTHLELDDYDRVGHDLGTTQGAYACGAAELPTDEWLSRRWLRGWTEVGDRMMVAMRDDAVWDDDRLAPLRPWRDRAADVWANRERLLAVVEAAPQTLVHCDFWPANVFVTDTGTVTIDWSQVGIGAVAQDVDQLTLDPVWMSVRPDDEPRLLETRVLRSYATGLRESGFDVDDATLWSWYSCAASAHYVPMLAFQAALMTDPAKIEATERRLGRDFDAIITSRARVVARAVELGEWALESAA